MTPEFAVADFELAFGEGAGHYEPGWNRVTGYGESVFFMYLGEGGGHTTTVPPTGVREFHEVQRPRYDVTESALWKSAVGLAEVLKEQANGPTRLMVERVMGSLNRAVNATPDGERRSAMGLSMRGKVAMEAAVRRGQPINELCEPVIWTTRAYVALDVPGSVAAHTLAYLLGALRAIRTGTIHPRVSPGDRVATIEHLIDTAFRLVSQRAELSSPAFFEMTYLASLYMLTAQIMAASSFPAEPSPEEVSARLARLEFNADELCAHRVANAFLLPAAMTQQEIVLFVADQAAAQGRNARELAESSNLYPALTSLLEQPLDPDHLSQADVEAHYISWSEARPGWDLLTATSVTFSPIPPSLTQ